MTKFFCQRFFGKHKWSVNNVTYESIMDATRSTDFSATPKNIDDYEINTYECVYFTCFRAVSFFYSVPSALHPRLNIVVPICMYRYRGNNNDNLGCPDRERFEIYYYSCRWTAHKRCLKTWPTTLGLSRLGRRTKCTASGKTSTFPGSTVSPTTSCSSCPTRTWVTRKTACDRMKLYCCFCIRNRCPLNAP